MASIRLHSKILGFLPVKQLLPMVACVVGLGLSMPAQGSEKKPAACISQRVHSIFDDEDLLTLAIDLRSGRKLQMLPPAGLKALARRAGVKSAAELTDPLKMDRLFLELRENLGNEEFERVAGKHIAGARSALLVKDSKTQALAAHKDLMDLGRGWGWRLLPENDPAFSDPRYLARLSKESGATGQVMDDPEWKAGPMELFRKEWAQIAPSNVHVKAFTLTGSDANNLLYDIADVVVERRLGVKSFEGPHSEILAFNDVFGAGSGKMQKIGKLSFGNRRKDLLITSPDSTVWEPRDPAEVARLKALENQALKEIRQKVKRKNPPIGGFLLEAVPAIGGVRFYRAEFLIRLRKLCDELQVPIFADEVMTGGGRTGRFFAYENYPGFEPDYVTFGKGLQVSGVAKVERGPAGPEFPDLDRMVTLSQYNEALIKSAQVMNRIRVGRLMENASEVGRYFVQKLRERERASLTVDLEEGKKELRSLVETETLERAKRQNHFVGAVQKMKEALEGDPQAYQDIMETLQGHYDRANQQSEERIKSLQAILDRKTKILQAGLNPSTDFQDYTHGLGMLIYSQVPLNEVEDGVFRLMPPLTLTRDQVDVILSH